MIKVISNLGSLLFYMVSKNHPGWLTLIKGSGHRTKFLRGKSESLTHRNAKTHSYWQNKTSALKVQVEIIEMECGLIFPTI